MTSLQSPIQEPAQQVHERVHEPARQVLGNVSRPEDQLHQGAEDADGGEDDQAPSVRAEEEPRRD